MKIFINIDVEYANSDGVYEDLIQTIIQINWLTY